MAENRKGRLLLVVVFGLEVGLLGLSVWAIKDLIEKGITPLSSGQLVVLCGAMIMVYLMYLKKEAAKAEDRVVGEKFRTGALLEAVPVPALLFDSCTVLGANARAAALLGVSELDLTGAALGDLPGGELGRRLLDGGAGSFEAETASGRRLRCTATPVGGSGDEATRLAILDVPGNTVVLERRSQAQVPDVGLDMVRQCAETVVPVLERSSDHLASLAAAARAASPHEASRAAQLSGVAVRLLQAARRIRLAQQLALIESNGLRASLKAEPFDFAATANEVTNRMRSVFAAAGVELAGELPDSPIQVRGDRDRVALVLRDLLEVCLAMTASGNRVQLAARPGDGELEVTVSDNGLGMGPEDLEGLFSSGGKPPVHGNYTGGIRDGLFVAKEILEAGDGQLWAESAPGRGTRFSLRLPLA
jgi:signal transduction histidine kinase